MYNMDNNGNKVIVPEKKPNITIPSINMKLDEKKSLSEQAKEYVEAVATHHAVQDQSLVDDLTTKKRAELKHNAEASLKKEKVELQKADYGVYEGVATYAGIKKPLPHNMQKILFTTLAFFQMIALLIVGTPTSIICIICDCADSIMSKLSSIAKSARWLVIIGLAIALVAVGVGFIVSKVA